MKDFKLLSYIKKYRIFIVLASLSMGVLFYAYFSKKQTFTASAIIQYRNEEATQGLAADGTEIDTTEIYSVEVMTKVFEKLGLNLSENNIDAVRAGVHVEAIQSQEEAAVQEALNEKGQVAADKPTMYLVSYTVGSRDVLNARDFSKQILNAMLNAYVETYAENHVNSAVPLYSVVGIYDKDYDYIEMVEILDDAVRRALDQLAYKEDGRFRSSDTGYSFSDLKREFSLLQNIDLPNTHAYVLGNQVTKDQDTLISKYENRIKNARLQNDASQTQSSGIDEIIETYVEMMRGSQNTDFTYEYILNDIYDDYDKDKERKRTEQTTEYDELMNNYVSERTSFETTLIDIAYDQYILDVYSGNIEEGGGATVQVIENPGVNPVGQDTGSMEGDGSADLGETDTITFDVDTVKRKVIVTPKNIQDTAYQMIKDLTDRIDMLYQVTLQTNQEYNRYAGAENIAIMTDTVTVSGLNLFVYAVLATVLFGVIGCVCAVVIGRTTEIFDYYVFMDKKLNVANRAGCDRYMAKYGKSLLPTGFVCISIRMTDIEQKNKKFGREICDQMMIDFCKVLQEILPSGKSFVANNSLGQFIVFLSDSDKEQAHAYVNELGSRCVAYNKRNECKVSYSCGISESGVDQVYDIKKLMIASIKKASEPVIRKIS